LDEQVPSREVIEDLIAKLAFQEIDERKFEQASPCNGLLQMRNPRSHWLLTDGLQNNRPADVKFSVSARLMK
jgi:hypothetical protein